MERIKLNIKETRLVALAVDGDNASTQAPIFAMYLAESEPLLFELTKEEAIPIFTIKDIIVPPKRGRVVRKIKVIFDGELANGDVKEFEFDIDAQYLMTFFPLHLIGETYIAIFEAGTRIHPKTTAISNNDLQVMLCLPEIETEEFRKLAGKFNSFLSYRSTSGMVGSEEFLESAETEALKNIRNELFINLSELANGNELALNKIKEYIEPLNSYEKNVLIQEKEPTETEIKTEALVTMVEQLLFKINVKNIIPKKVDDSELGKYRQEYEDFVTIMSQLDNFKKEDFEQLHDNDKKFLDAKNNADALSSYLASPISKNNLPVMMLPLADQIDFGGLYELDWTNIDNVTDFIDDNESKYSFGEKVVAALIASTIRISRISEVNGNTPIAFFLNVFSSTEPLRNDSKRWELEAFSERLAKGDTKLFKELITGLPKDVPMSTLINVSYLGLVGFALARSIIDEAWQQDIIRLAFNDNEIVLSYLDEVFANLKKFSAIAKEHTMVEEENLTDEKRELLESMISTQISFQSIQEALSTIGETFNNADEIANSMVEAMLQLADLNTGKKTASSINSDEWFEIKKNYLKDFFNASLIAEQ